MQQHSYEEALNYTIFRIHMIREIHPFKDTELKIAEFISEVSPMIARINSSKTEKVVLEISRMLTDMPFGGFA